MYGHSDLIDASEWSEYKYANIRCNVWNIQSLLATCMLSQSPSKPRRAYEPTRERAGDFLGHAPLNLRGWTRGKNPGHVCTAAPCIQFSCDFFPFCLDWTNRSKKNEHRARLAQDECSRYLLYRRWCLLRQLREVKFMVLKLKGEKVVIKSIKHGMST